MATSQVALPRAMGRAPSSATEARHEGIPAALLRSFRILVFDWDGTAVSSRSEDVTALRRPLERLLRAGVLVVVVTGTHVGHIHPRLSAPMRGPHVKDLFLATNRGSEVYGFDDDGALTLLSRRNATEEEERLLTSTADAVRDALVARTGLAIDVVYDRLNRRKVDLIPLPEWRDPPKSALPDLVRAVDARLVGGGLAGGLREAFETAERIVAQSGLEDARVTSDAKHIEIGLTDKADTMEWVMRELAARRARRADEVLVAGDELGPTGGFPGSDSKMLIPEAAGATVVSVGPEPAGAPSPTILLGGGPSRFRELVCAQAELHPSTVAAHPTSDPTWCIAEDGFVAAREHEIESKLALGNGFVGSRASLTERTPLSDPATFVAGVFGRSRPRGIADLVRLPDWARVTLHVEDTEVRVDGAPAAHVIEHRRVLDMEQGLLFRDLVHRDPAGRVTRVREVRLVSLADRSVLAQSIVLTSENYGGVVRVDAPFREAVIAADAGVSVAMAGALAIEQPSSFEWRSGDAGAVELHVAIGETVRIDRIVTVARAQGTDDVLALARRRLDETCRRDGLAGVLDAHREAWRRRWSDAGVAIEGDPAAQRAIRFAAYHLTCAANPDDPSVSIGARGLTGGAYKGHVFWETETLMLPFFTLTAPRSARALLGYRHATLPAARARAKALGYRGALYAWESARDGEDVTPPFVVAPDGQVVRIRVGAEEQHISADVAYAVWSYWRATSDDAFMKDAGAEMLVETARFWASRVNAGKDGRFHIRAVIGPDEYHESVDDNAYTNVMAQWNLERAAEIAAVAATRWPREWERLDVGYNEPSEWIDVARRMYTGLDPATGVFEQFRGYFALEDIDLGAYAGRTAPIDVVLGRERVGASQVIKQADVVMLLLLLWDRFAPEVREASFRYYEPRTGHGSSLSPPVHAIVAARLGDGALAERYFRQTAEIDLADEMGNAAGGVHLGALGGLWNAAVYGFGGLVLDASPPALRARLPPSWRRLQLAVTVRGERYELSAGMEKGAAR